MNRRQFTKLAASAACVSVLTVPSFAADPLKKLLEQELGVSFTYTLKWEGFNNSGSIVVYPVVWITDLRRNIVLSFGRGNTPEEAMLDACQQARNFDRIWAKYPNVLEHGHNADQYSQIMNVQDTKVQALVSFSKA